MVQCEQTSSHEIVCSVGSGQDPIGLHPKVIKPNLVQNNFSQIIFIAKNRRSKNYSLLFWILFSYTYLLTIQHIDSPLTLG